MEICPICRENLSKSIITECNHKFHFSCLHRWLMINPTCPVCRSDIEYLIDTERNDIHYYESEDEDDFYLSDDDYYNDGYVIVQPTNISMYLGIITSYILICIYIYKTYKDSVQVICVIWELILFLLEILGFLCINIDN